ncbi:kynurenine formamidase [Enterococcus sp. PF1-24]|uniref:cyclase family protein n=1 Tax=unclassified Enterococcus TaxID=2608891 RepID=UPI00247405E4|nr:MULTISPECIES: cyclase family protein [unclassified Enterococcus]MDH6363231.1 kynurenine formamidase [Enterococcus sp. PFB1-1]MDH6400468.1 kynurenine formamidase [Enterococcus sp. PF1-24]
MTTILESIAFLKDQKWVDLTHEVTGEIPYFASFQPLTEKTLFTVEADGFLAKEYGIVTQYGTHLDAPVHFSVGKRYLEEIGLKELVLPLYVIHKEKEVAENHDYTLTVEDILAFEAVNGKIPAGSFVAFASDWSKRWQDHQAYYNKDEAGQAHTPGWSMEALKFLHEERDVLAIGHETLDTDSAVDCTKNAGLLGELYWLSQNKFQVEVLSNLAEVPATGSAIFIGLPKIKQAPGFNVRAFAIVPE